MRNKIKRLFWQIYKIFESSYLCLRFPFLYPRNRFTDLHHNFWKLEDKINGIKEQYNRNNDKSVPKNAYKIEEYSLLGKEYHSYWISKRGYWLWKVLTFCNEKLFQIPFIIPTYTELDMMPDGWRKAFGIQICKEIKQSLLRNGGRAALKAYRILQIKEKYGELRWYDNGAPEEVNKIVEKYEYISRCTCIECGAPAKYFTQGWYSPYCEKHIGSAKDNALLYGVDIDWYGYKTLK